MSFRRGDFIGIRCEVQPGPFDDESLITVETIEGPITGFVKRSELRTSQFGPEVRARVEEIGDEKIKVLIFGSFFTTNGIAEIRSELAMAA